MRLTDFWARLEQTFGPAYAASLAVSQPAYILASVVGACALAIAAPVVLAWQQRQERRYGAQPGC